MSTSLAIVLKARLRPLDRRDRYETPLLRVLEVQAPGSRITGGGTLLSPEREPQSCDFDLDLAGDPQTGLALVIGALETFGAPKGSTARLGEGQVRPFGVTEGIGLYLNGTDLPDEVYANNDVNDLIQQLLRRLGDQGSMQSWWQGPRETALYLYGPSAARMRQLIEPVVVSHPLARQSRLVPLT
jgi:hypothetical protein